MEQMSTEPDNIEAAMEHVAETTTFGVSSNINATSREPATKQVMVRYTDLDHTRWKDAAAKLNISLSEFIRDTMNKKASELLDCQHPYSKRKSYPWSEICTACGLRLRG